MKKRTDKATVRLVRLCLKLEECRKCEGQPMRDRCLNEHIRMAAMTANRARRKGEGK